MSLHIDLYTYLSHAAYLAGGRVIFAYPAVYLIAKGLKYRFRKGWIIVVGMLCVAAAEPLAAELIGFDRLYAFHDSATPLDMAPVNSWLAAFILSTMAMLLIGRQGALPHQDVAMAKEKELRRLASKTGWIIGAIAWPICALAMMQSGASLSVSVGMSVFVAAAVGLLVWAIVGSFDAMILPH